eukprot:TRINITY_DN18306_c0_g1_i1.p1 TRINITY_DN18306_c0_g1~~TRINITY_DN18306_c0_g1_i1.p1  ORF type:complete len:256 (+),score=52.59 TRINITY_DN18306_c0_g1_i1:93-860(+)
MRISCGLFIAAVALCNLASVRAYVYEKVQHKDASKKQFPFYDSFDKVMEDQFARMGKSSQSHSDSSQVIEEVSTGKNGEQITERHIKKCHNGKCEERVEADAGKPSKKEADDADNLGMASKADSDQDQARKMGSEFKSSMDQMESNMRRMSRRMRDESARFEKSMDDMFDREDASFQSRMTPLMDEIEHLRGSKRRKHGDSSASKSEEFESDSESSEMTMKNGHMVKKTTRCKNGKCTTTVEEGDEPKRRQINSE